MGPNGSARARRGQKTVPRLTERRERRVVRKRGLEPPLPFGNKLLRLARLPVPPLPQVEGITSAGLQSIAEPSSPVERPGCPRWRVALTVHCTFCRRHTFVQAATLQAAHRPPARAAPGAERPRRGSSPEPDPSIIPGTPPSRRIQLAAGLLRCIIVRDRYA
jgi:hypothetical protein